MPSRRMRTRIYVVIFAIVAIGFLIPPTINLKHFRVSLSRSLSRSLGRQVSIQDVHLRLLPLPGFTFRQLRISDDDEFGAEPILQTAEDNGQHSVATLRLSSLWRGRLEIASVSLTQASLNLVRAPDGHWNIERLIDRAAQVPSAPTNKKQPETRTRFPYIEIKESRINFKFGAEKKPFTLSESEFALWLAAENRWNVRLKAVPLRTDESISDTGSIKLSGSFDRASQFSQTPFHFLLSWERPEVNAIARIARGHDPGWRGTFDLNAELRGTPADFNAHLDANIDEFRRYDIARPVPLDLRVSCENRFRIEVARTDAINQLDFNCKLPLESGNLTAQGELHPLGKSPDFSVRLFASEIPVSSLVRAMLHAKSTLPDDLSGEGLIDGSWTINRTAGSPVVWQGTLTLANPVLQSKVLRPALVFPRSVVVNFEAPVSGTSTKSGRKAATLPTLSRAVVKPFPLDLGGEVQVSATFDPDGYRVNADGAVDWQRLMQTARAMGLHPPPTDLQGSGTLTAQYSGEWSRFAPPTVSGQADIRSAVLSLRGFSEPLRVAGGRLKFDGPVFRAANIAGSFTQSGLEFVGDFAGTRQCERHVICDLTFALQTADLRATDLLHLLSVPTSGLAFPFFNSARQFDARWLLEIPASGSIAAQHLAIRKLQAKNVSAQLQLQAGKVLVRRWTADLFGGRHSGEWTFDFSGKQPAINGSGAVQNAHMEQVNIALDEQIGTGTVDLNYQLAMSGASSERFASSLNGSGDFVWHNGEIHGVHSDGEQNPSLSFSAWSGRFTVERRRIALRDTKMNSTSGVREVSGEVSFNREWNLTFARPNGNGFVATSIGKPIITNEPAKVAEARR